MALAEGWTDNLKGTWGLGGSILNSNYTGADTETTIAPYIFGSIGDLQIEANRVLYPLYSTSYYSILATGNYRTQQYSEALSLDKSIELGLTLDVPVPYGFTYRLAALADVSDTHEGYELEVQLYRHDNIDKLSLLTAISVQYQDDSLANYYYSTNGYTAGDGYVFEAEIIATYPIGDFALFAGVRSYWYGTNVSDSPLASSDNTLLSFFGVGYTF
jgi:outer membrane scaffolding protein for murein synthesis (MipA/OmpV family)